MDPNPNVWTRPVNIPWVRLTLMPNMLLADIIRGAVMALGFVPVAALILAL